MAIASAAGKQTFGYIGIQTSFDPNGKLNVVDNGAAPSTSTAIVFTDLIGQPTWIEGPNIQFKTPMRADLPLMGGITMPPTVVLNTQQANSQLINQRAAFQGGFLIINARHIGDFRNPASDAWVTVFEGAPLVQQGT